jgi:hypothetical protein
MPKPVCVICDETINVSTRKVVICPYCSFEACRTCCETYVLNESTPKCMNNSCGREWNRQFMRENFTNVFMTGRLKKHRENTLFEQEKALLPSTQPIVENMIKREHNYKRIAEVQAQIDALIYRRRDIERENYELGRNPRSTERSEFVRACPNEHCRGYLSTQWKCGICEQWVCPDCHEIKGFVRDIEHTCNPDNLATARLLSRDTKPCPKCHTGIFKIDGCDQMWCTQCHTAFNWRTGRIQDTVHNPHYFEWLRRNGNQIPRDQGDVPCGHNQLTHVTYREIANMLRGKHSSHALAMASATLMENVVRNTIHLRYAVMDQRNQDNEYTTKNQDLRVQYLRKIIGEDEFKIKLQQNEKKYQKKREINNVYDVLVNTISDITLRFQQHLQSSAPGRCSMEILDEIHPIINYANECFQDIAKTYGSKPIRIGDNMRIL